jgi:hypothetical protein
LQWPTDEDLEVPPTLEKPVTPAGAIKSFGPFGAKYRVGEAIQKLDNDDWMVEVVLIESGERAEYRLSRIESDPEAE